MHNFSNWAQGATCVITVFMPQTVKRALMTRFFDWTIDESATIGASLIMVSRLVLGPRCRISHGNVIKGCEKVILEEGARIGVLNWISSPPTDLPDLKPGRRPHLSMGKESSIVNRHLIDCTDFVQLGDYAVLAGNRSQILTHEPSFVDRVVNTKPVAIGSHSVVFTSTILTAGASVPARSVVAAGAVVIPGLTEELKLYGGVPAKALKDLDAGSLHFQRGN